MTGEIRTRDGRTLGFEDGGDPRGYPVVGLHGTPGCRYARWPDDGVYASQGVRYLTTDRAGYGLSTRRPGRSVADEVTDIEDLADTLGLARFAVTGGSGGGPHALACAALLPGRVERVSVLSGLAPLGPSGLPLAAWLDGMNEESTAEATWALEGEDRLLAELPALQRQNDDRRDASLLLGGGPNASDRAFLQLPEAAVAFRRIAEELRRSGMVGWVDDSLAFVRAWGFEVREITVPALLIYGLEDVTLPRAHGEWLAAHLRDVRTVVDEHGGHLPSDISAEIALNMAFLRPD